MPTCVAVGCTMRPKTNSLSSVKFFRFPKDLNRRNAWITALRREKWAPSENSRLCSLHFVSGMPSADPTHPDWRPTVFRHSVNAQTGVKAAKSLSRFSRAQRRRAASTAICAASEDCPPAAVNTDDSSALSDFAAATTSDDSSAVTTCSDIPPAVTSGNPAATSSDTAVAMTFDDSAAGTTPGDSVSDAMDISNSCNFATAANSDTGERADSDSSVSCEDSASVIRCLKQRISTLEASLAKRANYPVCSFSDDKMIKYYTGMPDAATFCCLNDLIVEKYSLCVVSKLGPKNEMLLVLMKLRLGLTYQDLAYRFEVARSSVSSIFHEWLDALARELQDTIIWPTTHANRKNLPDIFRCDEFRRTRVIVDCSEVKIQRPSPMEAKSQTYSYYKSSNTIKFLVGITPRGAVSFISRAYAGRISDKEATQHCRILERIEEGDVILADRGFLIEEMVRSRGARLVVPARTRGKKQLSAQEVEMSRRLSSIRIHVERAIGKMKNYKILTQQLPLLLIKRDSDKTWCTVDKILIVCAGLTNLQPCLVN